MRFTKMHGCGNDYVFVNGFEVHLADPASVARAVSLRHTGIGSDGLILILPSDRADVRMRIFNADGSEAQMCGNGIRCVAKYACEHHLTRANPMTCETLAGVLELALTVRDDQVEQIRVNMGCPRLTPSQIPVIIPNQDRVVDYPFRLGELHRKGTCVSMGNPHLVFHVADVAAVDLASEGPQWERLDVFPERTNVHFVEVIRPDEVRMRTWERGSGETLACGTGAAAVCVVGVLTAASERRITAHLPGGDLQLDWPEGPEAPVYMTGPAREVFTGDWPD